MRAFFFPPSRDVPFRRVELDARTREVAVYVAVYVAPSFGRHEPGHGCGAEQTEVRIQMDPIKATNARPPSTNQEEFRAGVGPVVCCVETSEANRVVRRLAGFGLRDLLAAYVAEAATGPLAFRSASRRLSLPGGLSVRFLAAGDMVSAPAAEDETKLAAAVSLRDDEQVDTTVLLDSRADTALASLCARREAGAWTLRWRTALEATLAHASHESSERRSTSGVVFFAVVQNDCSSSSSCESLVVVA